MNKSRVSGVLDEEELMRRIKMMSQEERKEFFNKVIESGDI